MDSEESNDDAALWIIPSDVEFVEIRLIEFVIEINT